MNNKVLCMGQIVADVIARPIDRLPDPGLLLMLDHLELAPGGCTCNTACVLAKLGVPTRLAGMVGNDPLSNAILGALQDQGIGIDFVVRSDKHPISSVIVCIASNGERSFLYKEGSSEMFDSREVRAGVFEDVGHVHVGGAMKMRNMRMAEMLRKAKENGCTTSLDTDWDPTGKWIELIEDALQYTDILFTNTEEGVHLTGCQKPEDIANCLLDSGVSLVIVKQGAHGCYIVGESIGEQVPALDAKVLDTTCAGDAFVGGFLYAQALGKGPVECAKFGNACGALSTTDYSHNAVQSSEQLVQMLARQAMI